MAGIAAAVSAQNSGCAPIMDKEGHIYKTMQTDHFCVMVENMRTTYDRYGKPIPHYDTTAANLNIPQFEYPKNNPDKDNVENYGLLYTWEAAKNLCPEGWYLPSKDDIMILRDYSASLCTGYSGCAHFSGKPSNSAFNCYQWTSTEKNELSAYYVTHQDISSTDNSACFSVRCVYRKP